MVLPSNEDTLESISMYDRPWKEMHQYFSFFPMMNGMWIHEKGLLDLEIWTSKVSPFQHKMCVWRETWLTF